MKAATVEIGDVHERMERMYRPQRYIYDLTRRYYLLGRDRLIRELGVTAGQVVLEVGCGTGRNLVAIGRRYPGVLLCGLEPSRTMLEATRKALRAHGLEQRAKLVYGTAETVTPADFGVDAFDRMLFSYCLSMVRDPVDVLDRLAPLVRATGSLELVDFGPMDGLPHILRQALVAWLDRFGVHHRPEISTALRTIATKTGGTAERWSIGGGYAELMRLNRALSPG